MKPQDKLKTIVAANDNGVSGSSPLHVQCDLPKAFGVLHGEAELISRFMGHILLNLANDETHGGED